MGFKQWTDDEVLTEADLDKYLIQQVHAIKTADQTVTSSTILVPDDELAVSLLANTTYWLEFFLIYDAIQAADLKLGWAYPTSAQMHYSHGGLRAGATSTVDQISRTYFPETGFPTIGGPAAASGTNTTVMGEGIVITAGSSGELRLRFAQVTSNATGTVLKANSTIICQKLPV